MCGGKIIVNVAQLKLNDKYIYIVYRNENNKNEYEYRPINHLQINNTI